MKTSIAAFALLLMAGAAPQALAQDHDRGRDYDQQGAHPGRPSGGERGNAEHVMRQAPPAAAPAAAPQAPPAPVAREPRADFRGRWGGERPTPAQGQPQGQPDRAQFQDRGRPQPQGRPGGGGDNGQRFVRRPGTWVDTNGDDTSHGLSPADRADQEDRQELRDDRRYNGGRDNRGGDNRGGDPRAGDHRTGDHRDGDHRDRPQWRPGAYPHSIHSDQRFHVRAYRRPPNFFFRTWGFGEILPQAWYGAEYAIVDWWDYGLPAPPYGYEWVRVGDDALLVDDYTGRIVQVVSQLFW